MRGILRPILGHALLRTVAAFVRKQNMGGMVDCKQIQADTYVHMQLFEGSFLTIFLIYLEVLHHSFLCLFILRSLPLTFSHVFSLSRRLPFVPPPLLLLPKSAQQSVLTEWPIVGP